MSNGLPPGLGRTRWPGVRRRVPRRPTKPDRPRKAVSTASVSGFDQREVTLVGCSRPGKYPDFCTMTFRASSRSANLLANQAPGLIC